MKLFQTKAYKVLMNYVYGWGASAVIIGALFKIMHFPGAGIILTIGMLVEAFIFFLSAFVPALEHYDWSRVFPALSSKEIEQGDNVPVQMPVGMTGNPVQTVRSTVSGKIDLGLEAEDLDKLKTGIHKIAETADNFAGIVGERTSQVSKALEESVRGISSGCEEINSMLLDSAQSLTRQMKENCEKLSMGMGSSAEHFSSLGQLMEEQLQHVKSQTSKYAQQLSGSSKKISALNALYELQIQETKDCLDTFRGMQGDMGEMLEHVSLSLDSAKLFKQESQQLANNVASLNSVYGNMLSVVNNN